MLEAARAGRSYADVEAAGLAAVAPDEVIDGVRELVDEVRLEVLVGDGTRLIVLRRSARSRPAGRRPTGRARSWPARRRPPTATDAAAAPRLSVRSDIAPGDPRLARTTRSTG